MHQPGKRLKIVMLVGGFPVPDNPARCVFNQRAADDLGKTNDVTVIFARLWRPGKKIINHIKAENYNLYIVYVPFPFANGFQGIKVKHFSKFIGLALKRVIQECDILHSVGADTIGVMGSNIAKVFHKKHVAQLIGSDINTVLPDIKNEWYVKGWQNYIHGISANSKALLNAFYDLYPDNKNIAGIVNYRGVKTEYFKPGDKADSYIQILFIGGLPPYPELPFKDDTKGGRTLMKVWSEIDAQTNIPCKLIFAGPESDNVNSKSWYDSLTQKEKVVITGNLSPKDVNKYMSESHLVLIPSMEEGTPNACYEAMASGCAVFGSNVGGIPELLDHDINGKILPPGDKNKWLEALLWALNNPIELKQMGAKARAKAIERFDYRDFTKRLEKLYKEII